MKLLQKEQVHALWQAVRSAAREAKGAPTETLSAPADTGIAGGNAPAAKQPKH